MSKILVIHGPNLNLYFKRVGEEKRTLKDINEDLLDIYGDIDFIQTNDVGVMIDALQSANEPENYAGIIINVTDAYDECKAVMRTIKLIKKPTVEVNSRINKEPSDLRPVTVAEFAGELESMYRYALNWLSQYLNDEFA